MRALALCAFVFSALLSAQPNDLFLLAGQSNMAGRGVVGDADRKPIPGVSVFNKEGKWAPAIDPLHWDKPQIAGVGLGRSFAQTLIALGATKSIGLIPAAFGGSALDEWKPDQAHYKNAVERTKAALQAAGPGARLRGILWHQGEADSGTAERASTYPQRFEAFITQLRADLGAPDVPVVVGQLGRFILNRTESTMPLASQVNGHLAAIPLTVKATAFVSSEGLTDKGDFVHFDTPSLYELGRRYALAWMLLNPPKR